MIKQCLYIVMILFLCITSALSNNQKLEWILVTDDNDIQVYILDTPGSKIVKAKSKTIVKSPLTHVKAMLDDVDHRHEWIPFLVKSKTLINLENNKRIEYSHFYAPWPATDRDFVYLIELTSITENELVYDMHSVESDLMPVDKNKIRADLFETIYVLTVIDENTTAVELIYHADPKGWIPTWIINIMQRVLPYKILNNLKNKLEV